VPGGGDYEALLAKTIEVVLFGATYRCVDLETLIRLKRAAGRPKDFEAIAELETLLEERSKP
jgi:predicted nucleotidyltransferase